MAKDRSRTIEITGVVTGKSKKDVAKGKDAETHPVGLVEVKLASIEGLQGSAKIPTPYAGLESNWQIGDQVSLVVTIKQGRLKLASGGDEPAVD